MYTNIYSTFFICYVKEKSLKALLCFLAVQQLSPFLKLKLSVLTFKSARNLNIDWLISHFHYLYHFLSIQNFNRLLELRYSLTKIGPAVSSGKLQYS